MNMFPYKLEMSRTGAEIGESLVTLTLKNGKLKARANTRCSRTYQPGWDETFHYFHSSFQILLIYPRPRF